MSNPLLGVLGGTPQNTGNNAFNMMSEFQAFVQRMQGKNPNEEIQKLLQSGRINQAQLNQAQQMAQQMQGMFKCKK